MVAVVSASLGVLGPLLRKLTALLANEYGRLKGVRRQILSLQCELSSMHAAVKKYTMLEDPDVQVKQWISMVRELAYDVEDCIDKFIHKLGNGGRHGGFKEFFRKTARQLKTLASRHGIADQIDELKACVNQVKELKSCYKLDDMALRSSQHTAVDPRLSALFVEEAHIVGIDGPRDDLAEWLVEDVSSSTRDNLRVLSIVGFGGLGKTTLANELSRKIQGHFHCQAFVSVSQKPDIKKIIKEVISQVIPQVIPQRYNQEKFREDLDIWDENKSIAKLRELIQDKRYLVIIDDIWSIPEWDLIKCAFPENNYSSRIIATTRITDVARSCCLGGGHRMYEMKPLSGPHSENLFFKRIFGSGDGCPDMLKEVSNEILKKCGGLPLAIISISSLLANKPTSKEEWLRVKRSIGSALDKNKNLEGMNSILCLSYNDLPPNLKTCLLYLSNFPEDCVIDRERLVRRWIAEGFICGERGQNQREVAENYFYELINKSMVQAVDIGYDGKARACRVHDMMLELIISKSAEDNFVTVIGTGQTDLENRHGGSIRRLSVQHIDQHLAFVLANEDLSHVRSLTITSSSGIEHLPSLSRFENLRILDFEGCIAFLGNYITEGMEKLLQLKYLSLSGTWISHLPSGIVMLHNLETLDILETGVEELPAGIVHLSKLQHLIGSSGIGNRRGTKIPIGIGNMTNLRVFLGFGISLNSAGVLEELVNLINLEELGVVYYELGPEYKKHEDMFLSSLCKLGCICKLKSFKIHRRCPGRLDFLELWCPPPFSLQTFEYIGCYYFNSITQWMSPALTNLAYLDINLLEGTEEGLRILGEMPALLCLWLVCRTIKKERLAVNSRGFQCLREFRFWSAVLPSGNLLFEEGALPKLEKLQLIYCVSMVNSDEINLGIKHLPRLKNADVSLYKEGATSSEITSTEVALRNEANVHPNRPMVTLKEQKKKVFCTDNCPFYGDRQSNS